MSSDPPLRPMWTDPELSPKIREPCRVAREKGYRYLWIDSCCIDKTSSSELSESINSMYQWYARADVCYAFLPDVPSEEDHRAKDSAFRRSVWFGRGWTLQELIAPMDVVFLAQDWMVIGSKLSLGDLVEQVTNIDYDALLHVESLDKFSVAQRLSWAANRKTTRVEDRAYSLLGIFDINMPTLYGEGDRAFRRLQEEIMRRTPDQSLFAWTSEALPLADPLSDLYDHDTGNPNETIQLNSYATPPSLLAPYLDFFRSCTGIEALSHDEVVRRLQLPTNGRVPATDYDFTPYGIRVQLPVISISSSLLFPPKRKGTMVEVHANGEEVPLPPGWYLVILGCEHRDFPGHLFGRVCYTKSSGSSIESLYSGMIRTSTSRHHLDILPISPTTVMRIHPHISSKTLYIPQPRRDEGAKQFALYKPHEAINMVLLKKTREVLSAQGYLATLRAPDDAHRTTHMVTLVHDTHTITIDYRHTLEEEHETSQRLTIKAHVKTSGPLLQDAPDDLGVSQIDGHGTEVSWTDTSEYEWEPWFKVKDLELIIPGPMVLTMQLGLAFAARNHYLLQISIESAPVPVIEHSTAIYSVMSIPVSQ